MKNSNKKGSVRWWCILVAFCSGCTVVQDHQSIDYQDDVSIKGNHVLYGFRPLPVRSDTAEVTEKFNKSPLEVSQCLQRRLESQFKLPPEFYAVRTYTNNAQTISLVNPFTKTEGLQMDITATGVDSSMVKLYANGTVLSKAWKRFPLSCH